MRRYDKLTFIGIILGVSLILLGIGLDELPAFINPQGLMITVGGSFGALLINFQVHQMRQVAKITYQALLEKKHNVSEIGNYFVYLAQKARREGLLSLEDDLEEIDDPFLHNGLQMVIDGFEPEAIKEIMETELRSISLRHQLGQNLFRTWGSLTPAFGMMGTLIGLVQMLAHLYDPDAIGPGMAVALLTTFYGILLANLILNPIAGKLAVSSEEELTYKEAVIDALLALQAGVNPRILQEKIKAYLSPQERVEVSKDKSSKESSSEESSTQEEAMA